MYKGLFCSHTHAHTHTHTHHQGPVFPPGVVWFIPLLTALPMIATHATGVAAADGVDRDDTMRRGTGGGATTAPPAPAPAPAPAPPPAPAAATAPSNADRDVYAISEVSAPFGLRKGGKMHRQGARRRLGQCSGYEILLLRLACFLFARF